LRKAEERAHILEGLIIAIDNLDEVIRIIRASKTVEDAKTGLMKSLDLSEIQAKAVLEMRLQKLVSLEMEKLRAEYDELMKTIASLKEILASEGKQREIIKEELREIKEEFGDERRTQITYADGEISVEDMIPNDEVVISISNLGYIKRTKLEEYKQQARGGKGSRGSKTRNEDYIDHLFVAHNHNYLLLFTEQGRCFWMRAYEIPEATKTASGRVIQNLLAIPKEDKVTAYIMIQDLTNEEFLNNNHLIFCTRKGLIKKTLVEAFSRPRVNGINAITINEGDSLLEVLLTDGSKEIMIANKLGKAIRFDESKVRSMGRSAAGVKAMKIDTDNGDEIVGMLVTDPADEVSSILTVTENGMGKRTLIPEYRLTNRGGKGVTNLQVTDKTGSVFAVKKVTELDHIMITTKAGIMIRMKVSDLRNMGRATQGVKLINVGKKDSIADIAIIKRDENSDEEE